jgi:dihydroorotate dehydrogenase (fumarate)
MKEQMLQWMTEHGYETIAQFKGHLNMNTSNGASLYKRTQFMKYFSGYRGV